MAVFMHAFIFTVLRVGHCDGCSLLQLYMAPAMSVPQIIETTCTTMHPSQFFGPPIQADNPARFHHLSTFDHRSVFVQRECREGYKATNTKC